MYLIIKKDYFYKEIHEYVKKYLMKVNINLYNFLLKKIMKIKEFLNQVPLLKKKN